MRYTRRRKGFPFGIAILVGIGIFAVLYCSLKFWLTILATVLILVGVLSLLGC